MQVNDGGGVFSSLGSGYVSPQIANNGRSDRYVVNSSLNGYTSNYAITGSASSPTVITGSITQGSASDINSMFVINANCNSSLTGTTIFANSNSNRTCGFAALSSNGFTYDEVVADYSVIQTFQEMLGRAN